MANAKRSTKGRVCSGCRKPKSELEYPSSTAEVCLSCLHEAENTPKAPVDELLATVTTGEVIDEAPFVPTDSETDYLSPTAQELAARTLARRRLLPFIKRFRPKYMAGWVHEDICRRLERFMEAVEAGLEPRLLLMMPVRMGKSEIASRHFAPWVLGHHPDWEIIAASGAQSLATSFSRYIRDLVRSDSYKALFPEMALDPSSTSVENWNTTRQGGYLAAGIGTMITGRGCSILVIDDPVKDAEAADSSVIRDNTWEWYMSTALSRLAPGGGVLGILTWWNEDDWAGRIQQLSTMEDADTFEIVKYPAINDQGDEYILPDDSIEQLPPGSDIPEGARMTRPMNTALHPARYTLASLLKRKATYYALGQQRWWHALYQQSPTVDDGVYFTKKMFRFYVNEPHPLERSVYQTWDFAITEGQQNDYTVGATGYQDTGNNLHVADIVRFKSDDSFVIADAILDNWVAHGSCALLGFEDGQIWKAVSAVFLRRCEERGLFPSYELMVPLSDKAARAQPLRGLMQGGKVWFKDKAPWWEPCRKELTQFLSGGKHDDIVDACFIAGTKVTMWDGSQANIEWLAEGDWVDTPFGPRAVLDAECTCNEAVVYEVGFSDGRVLVGTAEHPVSTDRGWVPLAHLTASDIIHVRGSQDEELSSCLEYTKKPQQTSTALSSTGSYTGGIPIQIGRISAGIIPDLVGEDSCTEMSGNSTTDLYRVASSFITRMKIISTTILRTLSVCRVNNIRGIDTQSRLNIAGQRNSSPTLLKSATARLSGTSPQKEGRGTSSTPKTYGSVESLCTVSASIAETSSDHRSVTQPTVANLARTRLGTQRTLTMVRRSVLEQRHAVYNLTVDDVECYYANGVLVHNCAWLARLSLKHTAPRKPEPKKLKSWKDGLMARLSGIDRSHMSA